MADPVRLGGMALENGVLVHGPEHWACAVRTEAGEMKVASGRKPLRAADVRSGVLRGPARLAEVFALLPVVRSRLPEARLPYERPRVVAALAGGAAAIRGLRTSALAPVLQEMLAALVAAGPAVLALRGSALAEYHGAEHISIGTYEHGEPREREHERCGSHLVGPLLVTTTAGSLASRLLPPHVRVLARAGAAVGAMAASVELFGWMVKHERHPVARALARPGHELQHRVLTAEPSPEQLEVANAALTECLRLERGRRAPSLESARNGGREEADEAPAT
jgi:uncharacterized protein YqhQ